MKSKKAHFKIRELASIALLGMVLGATIPQIGSASAHSQQVLANQITLATPTKPSQANQEEAIFENTEIVEMSGVGFLVAVLVAGIVIAAISIPQGCVKIGDDEVGIVIKRFNLNPGHPKLPAYRSIALNGEAGCQADTLAPGWHFGYWSWMYTIRKEPVIRVRQGEIALVMANDGQPLPSGRNLGRAIPACMNFQDARAFLVQGGEKGPQIEVLPPGDYRINTRLFTVITSDNVNGHSLNLTPKDLKMYRVNPGMLGVVTTLEGKTLPPGEIAGPRIPGHDNFQNGQKFVDGGGYKGLQEEVLLEGAWQLNPWFVKVEQRQLTHISAGTVGVVISHVGRDNGFGSIETLVEPGYKGVWRTPFYPGKHPINTEVMDIVVVPTHHITLDWSNKKTKQPENYDSQLHALRIHSKDGFPLNVEVTQIIRISGQDAPKMISRVGSPGAADKQITISSSTGVIRFASIRSLVNRVLEPMVGNYFYNSAQGYEALDFHDNRVDRQGDAIDHIKKALIEFGVEALGTYINEIDLPDVLEKVRNGIKIAEQEGKLYEAQRLMEVARRQFVYEQALTEIQRDLVRYEQGIKIADLKAIARRYESLAEADATRAQGKAQAEIMQAVVDVMGQEGFLDVEKLKQIANLKLPDVWVSGADAGGSGSVQALIASILRPGNSINASNLALTNGVQPNILPKSPTSPSAVTPAITEPRCPIVLLLDTSNSMSNEYINQLTEGLVTFKRKVLKDATASRRAEIAVIKFGSPVEVVQNFTTVDSLPILPSTKRQHCYRAGN
ncbi:SPFH domain-containing protein [Scytonema sp. PRP1]|uniref:SPFH domain-containing protein n=1 Tax=Scytonema sp. PRP1 TaxID=3120513 RepID=UPI00300D5638